MRFERLHSLLALVLLGGFSSLRAQEAVEVKPSLDELKLVAQQAAIPHLGGGNPFILRESTWSGEVEPGKARLIQVQLFKRNDYHFWVAVPDRKAAVNLNLYNGKGELLEAKTLRYETPNLASLIATPSETGIYYLRLSLQSTVEETQPWTVIYAYR
jgi:hypothetical protein